MKCMSSVFHRVRISAIPPGENLLVSMKYKWRHLQKSSINRRWEDWRMGMECIYMLLRGQWHVSVRIDASTQDIDMTEVTYIEMTISQLSRRAYDRRVPPHGTLPETREKALSLKTLSDTTEKVCPKNKTKTHTRGEQIEVDTVNCILCLYIVRWYHQDWIPFHFVLIIANPVHRRSGGFQVDNC